MLSTRPCFKCKHFILEKQGCRLFDNGPVWHIRSKIGICKPEGNHFEEKHKSCWDCKYYNSLKDVCTLFPNDTPWHARSKDGHCGEDGFFFVSLDDDAGDYTVTHHHIVDQ